MKARHSSWVLLLASLAAAGSASCGDGDAPAQAVAAVECEVEPTQAFHERIEPLLTDTRSSTCNQCHLSGVDLSVFARETPCKTWACLVEQDLVNPAAPDSSRILSWIERAQPDSELITTEVIAAERDAFKAWIEANAQCPSACAGVTCGELDAGPTCLNPEHEPPQAPEGDVELGCSDKELEQAFYDDVYSWRGRCFPCHYDTEKKADPTAPRWLSVVGNCATGSAASLKRAIGLGLIDTEDPSQSLLVLKPLDVAGGGVTHGGGSKFTLSDPAYASFLRFATHYKECVAP
ncbi:MAG: hypothetical protein EOO73_23290 [Myxococcales bacterium]|nr:MAG: hypothetical protein EOO73_23290 [Myxococcales bacterium]